MYRILSVFLILFLIALSGHAQTTRYTAGGLIVDVFQSNPCEGTPNGYLLFSVVATSDNMPAQLQVIVGPPNHISIESIPVGSTYKFNASETLPVSDGYEFIILGNNVGDVISTFGSPLLFTSLPDIVVADAPATDLSNSDCTSPNGQISVSVAGGSKVLAGGGQFKYRWETTNGLLGFPITGTTDGNSILDLASLAGLSGLPGGDYTLRLEDSLSNCFELRNWSITDPQPSLYSITNGPNQAVCQGSDAVVQLSGSETGVAYRVLINGVFSGVSVMGTGAPLSITLPAGSFSSGQTIVIQAMLGSCIPRIMTGHLIVTINALPTISGVVVGSLCQGGTTTNINYTSTTGSPNQYSIDFTPPAEAQGFVDVVNTALGASPLSMVVPPGAAPGTYYATLTVRNNTTGCVSTDVPISITIIANPTITLGANPSVCIGATTAALPYSATTGSPNQYSIDFNPGE